MSGAGSRLRVTWERRLQESLQQEALYYECRHEEEKWKKWNRVGVESLRDEEALVKMFRQAARRKRLAEKHARWLACTSDGILSDVSVTDVYCAGLRSNILGSQESGVACEGRGKAGGRVRWIGFGWRVARVQT